MANVNSPVRSKGDGQNLFSQVPGNPTFRNQAVNAVAIVPLMQTFPATIGATGTTSNSDRSFKLLLQSLERYAESQVGSGKKLPKDLDDFDDDTSMEDVEVVSNHNEIVDSESPTTDVLLIVPNSQLTRPGDWRYEKTPLKNFHWGHGCQRLICFDGRPHKSRRAHDRLLNHSITREWIDLCPSRRTAAVVGVLNLRDIEGMPDGLKRAEVELQQWAERYSTPSYEVSAYGRSFARDGVVQRLFVFDSFKGDDQIDLSSSRLGSNLVAFPPSENLTSSHTMDMHLNVVVNDLAVAIFRQLEIRIRESDAMAKEKSGWRNIGAPMAQTAARAMRRNPSTAPPQLLTPLDSVWDLSEVSPKDADAMRRRDVGRREKMAADLSLLAGSPMDAYERYSKAAELAKQSPDPLWYASALEGCAAAHMAMAEAGGYNVDAYLESNFQLPEEFMSVVHTSSSDAKKTSVTKQTLPAVIYALCEEALIIFSRHEALAGFHAELLLTLAWYNATMEESHMRCRWGEGYGCYGGDPSEPRRWDKTSVARLTFGNLINKEGEDLIGLTTLLRTQKFCEFVHRAVSTGALDPLTRADVAAAAARLCLEGLQSTRWKFNDGYLVRLPRKAAFFATVAAEALSKYTARDTIDYQGSSLWLAATQLYSKSGNAIENETKKYGWSTLRATVLHALSQQEDAILSETASELVLMLMSEMSSQEVVATTFSRETLRKDDESFYTRTTVDDDSESVATMSSRRTNITKYSSTVKSTQGTIRTAGFFSTQGNQQTLLCVAQAKWADDKAIPPLKLPLVEELSDNSLANSLVAFRAVLSKIDLENCALAQQRLISQITEIRKDAPTLSYVDYQVNSLASYYSGETAPLKIDSAMIVKSPSHLLLERTKAHGFSGKATGAMATFFNPFENKKKQAEKKIAAILVAEGEEREVEIEFSNQLSVPLEVPSCEVVFSMNDRDRIKAPALSFTIPPKAQKFKARFPFIVIKKRQEDLKPDEKELSTSALYEVMAIRLTCLSRHFIIPVSDDLNDDDPLLPISASVYTRSKHNKPKKKDEEVKPRFETVPAQPNLHVSFSNSQTSIEDGTTVPVHLSDGEIFTIPSFRLQNDFGPSGLGLMERLQIIGVGMPGIPEEVLFDTDAAAAALEEEDDDNDSGEEEEETDAFEQLMEEDGLPPLKMKAQCESLSIKSINDKSIGDGSLVTFQVAATHDMGNQLANGGNVRIRFRYRGISPNPATEIWRKREVALRIIRVKGPRISSLTFRSDLSWGSSYSELCHSLAEQKVHSEAIARKWGSHRAYVGDVASVDPINRFHSSSGQGEKANEEKTSLISRVGMDAGVHVASDEIVVLMAVANETNSTILLSNRKGRVGGFSGSPMPTVRVTSGVSVKIPVVIPRIARLNLEDPDQIVDIAAELVANTALTWKSVPDNSGGSLTTSDDDGGSNNTKVRQGRVRIPSKCLREIISEHSSFTSRICVAPVTVQVRLGRPEGKASLSVKRLGGGTPPVTVQVIVHINEWVPSTLRERLTITMELACARKNANASSSSSIVSTTTAGGGVKKNLASWIPKKEYVWCGLLRRTVSAIATDKEQMNHHARVVFLCEGTFVVSACAKVSAVPGVEEVWWAPIAEQVLVS